MRADDFPGQGAGSGAQQLFARVSTRFRRVFNGIRVVGIAALYVFALVVFIWSAGWDGTGTLGFEFVALAVFTWLLALVFGPLLRLSPLYKSIAHRKLMLVEIGLGTLIATAPAIGLPLGPHLPFPGNTAMAHSALAAMALAGFFIVFGAILLHLWRPVNNLAASLREEYRRRQA